MPLYLIKTLPQVSSQIERTLLPHVVEAPASNLQTRDLELVRNLVDRLSETGKPLPSLQVFLADFEAWCQSLIRKKTEAKYHFSFLADFEAWCQSLIRKKTKAKDHISSLANLSLKAWTEHNQELGQFAKSNRKFAEDNRDYLIGANLSEADLVGADLVGANLSGANLSRAILRRANLERAVLEGADLTEANLERANLKGAFPLNANFERANLEGADLTEANLYEANFRGANLQGAILKKAILYEANLQGANCKGANLRVADLTGADCTGANLRVADLRGANCTRADLFYANLFYANLNGANLSKAQLGFNQIRSLQIFKQFTEKLPKFNYNMNVGTSLASILPSTIGSKIQLVLPRASFPRHAHVYTAEWLEVEKKLKISYDDNELPHAVRAHMKGSFTIDLKTDEAEILNYSAIDKWGKNVATLENQERPNFLSDSLSDLRKIMIGTDSPGQGSSIALYDPSGKREWITYPAHTPSTAPDEKVREWADLQGIVLI